MAVFRTLGSSIVKKGLYKASRNFVPIAQKFYLDNFEKEGYNINGFVRWKELTEMTKSIRKKKGFPYPQYKILQNTGRLKRGIKVRATTQGISIFNNVSYAQEQNDIRPFIYESAELQQKFADYIGQTITNELNNIRWL